MLSRHGRRSLSGLKINKYENMKTAWIGRLLEILKKKLIMYQMSIGQDHFLFKMVNFTGDLTSKLSRFSTWNETRYISGNSGYLQTFLVLPFGNVTIFYPFSVDLGQHRSSHSVNFFFARWQQYVFRFFFIFFVFSCFFIFFVQTCVPILIFTFGIIILLVSAPLMCDCVCSE